MTDDRAEVRLTGREADALHGLLAMILNDGAWEEVVDLAAIERVDGKVVAAIRNAIGQDNDEDGEDGPDRQAEDHYRAHSSSITGVYESLE